MVGRPSPWTLLSYATALLLALVLYWFVRNEVRSLGRRLGVTRRVAVPVFAAAGVGVVELWRRGTVPTDGPGEFPFAAAGAGYLLGVVLVAVALGNAPTFLRARRTETTLTGTVDSGRVEVSGRAREPEDLATAPFTGRDALYYEYEVTERGRLLTRRLTRTVDAGADGTAFPVDDGTGAVLVDPAGADVRLGRERLEAVTVDGDERPPDRVRAFLAESDDLGPAETRRTYREWVLEPGAEVYVQGVAGTEYAGEYPAGTVVGVDGTPFLAPGSVASVERSLRRTVLAGGVGGLVLTVAGYAGMAALAGLV